MKTLQTVAERLLGGEEYRFSFFQAVRLCDLLFARESWQRTGWGDFPESEPLRFLARVSMAFPPSELYALGFDPEDGQQFDRASRTPRALDASQPRIPLAMTVNFFGLFGPKGVLPLHYTELVMRRTRLGDTALRDFFDKLGHRFIAFFYRAWAKHRIGVGYEWAARHSARQSPSLATPRRVMDDFSRYLRSLVGLGLPSLQERMAVPDEVIQYYAGLFSQQHRPKVSLVRLVQEYFALPPSSVFIEEFVPQVLPLPQSEQSRLGEAQSELGVSTVIGDEVLLEDSKFELRLGPFELSQFRAFLPPQDGLHGGESFVSLVHLVRFYVGPELDFDVRLVLKKESAFHCALGGGVDSAAIIGVAAWLLGELPAADLADSVFPSTLA